MISSQVFSNFLLVLFYLRYSYEPFYNRLLIDYRILKPSIVQITVFLLKTEINSFYFKYFGIVNNKSKNAMLLNFLNAVGSST